MAIKKLGEGRYLATGLVNGQWLAAENSTRLACRAAMTGLIRSAMGGGHA